MLIPTHKDSPSLWSTLWIRSRSFGPFNIMGVAKPNWPVPHTNSMLPDLCKSVFSCIKYANLLNKVLVRSKFGSQCKPFSMVSAHCKHSNGSHRIFHKSLTNKWSASEGTFTTHLIPFLSRQLSLKTFKRKAPVNVPMPDSKTAVITVHCERLCWLPHWTELQARTQTLICGCPTHSTMPATLNMKLSDQPIHFFKEVNRFLFPIWTEVGRPHLTYKIQTIFTLS